MGVCGPLRPGLGGGALDDWVGDAGGRTVWEEGWGECQNMSPYLLEARMPRDTLLILAAGRVSISEWRSGWPHATLGGPDNIFCYL